MGQGIIQPYLPPDTSKNVPVPPNASDSQACSGVTLNHRCVILVGFSVLQVGRSSATAHTLSESGVLHNLTYLGSTWPSSRKQRSEASKRPRPRTEVGLVWLQRPMNCTVQD